MKLFDEIIKLNPRLYGWATPEKACTMAAAVLAIRPNVTVEIGVFGGRSLLPMAMAHKETGQGVVWGIDPWLRSESVQGQVNAGDVNYWQTLDHEIVYHDFLANLAPLGIQNIVKVIRSSSNAIVPPPVIDLLHVDGNHGEQAATDAKRFSPSVRLGGLCFLDDLDWAGGGVRRAEGVLISSGFIKLYSLDTGAMFQRVRKQ